MRANIGWTRNNSAELTNNVIAKKAGNERLPDGGKELLGALAFYPAVPSMVTVFPNRPRARAAGSRHRKRFSCPRMGLFPTTSDQPGNAGIFLSVKACLRAARRVEH
jgi:hypothetical protein